jgi:hypothetical protein
MGFLIQHFVKFMAKYLVNVTVKDASVGQSWTMEMPATTTWMRGLNTLQYGIFMLRFDGGLICADGKSWLVRSLSTVDSIASTAPSAESMSLPI